MDITFKCDRCSQHIVIDEAGAGLQVECPKCGLSLAVPQTQPGPSKPSTPAPDIQHPKAVTATPPQAVASVPETKQCPFCAETIKSEAIVCRHCGRDLVAKQLTEAVAEKVQGPPTTTVVVCPKCGSHNIVRKEQKSTVGWGLIAGGFVAAFFTCGLGLVLCVIGLFLNEERYQCGKCGWDWKT